MSEAEWAPLSSGMVIRLFVDLLGGVQAAVTAAILWSVGGGA